MCNCAKDQTTEKDLDQLAEFLSKGQKPKGIGVFVVPAPELGILEYKVVICEEEITYEECAKRGHNCESFKWVIGKTKEDAIAAKNENVDCGMCRNRNTNPYCSGNSLKCMCSPNHNICIPKK